MAAISLPRPGAAPTAHAWESVKLWRRRVAARIMQRRVRLRDFSIISNDCWGGMAYEELGLPYQSPFVGLFIVPHDFVRLLRSLRSSVEGPIEFRARSRDPDINAWREQIGRFYPIGVLRDDVEVHFLHYPGRAEAEAKWRRRSARIQWNRLRLKASWHDHPGVDEDLREFDGMDLGPKVILAPQVVPGTRCSIALKDFSTDGTQQYWRGHKAFDVASFIDRGEIRTISWTRMLGWLFYWHY